MSSNVNVQIEGQRELIAQLQRLGGPRLRALARRVATSAMRPVVAEAKARVPVESGRIRASLGQLASTNRRRDAFSSRVGTRRDFVYRSTSGQRLVSGRGKIRDRAVAKGVVQDRRTAQQYARVIEFGVDRRGRMRRKAGPARFLEGAIQAQQTVIVGTVAASLRTYVQSNP